MRRTILLLLWLAGLIFPLSWLGRFSPAYQRTFDRVFGAEWMHVVTHALLFAGLAILLVYTLRLPLRLRSALAIASLALLTGMLQEAFQIFSRQVSLGDSLVLRMAIFDLWVDLSGALAGFALLAVVLRRLHRPTSQSQEKPYV
jgi:VanZ family protein